MAKLVEGKRALIVGVANKRSIAWSIARALDENGASIALTYQNERVEKDVRKLSETLASPGPVVPLDVQDDAQMDASMAEVAAGLGGIDILVHAVAFARQEDLSGRLVDVSRDGFLLSMDISAYSLVAVAGRVEPHMREAGGGSIMTLSYICLLYTSRCV